MAILRHKPERSCANPPPSGAAALSGQYPAAADPVITDAPRPSAWDCMNEPLGQVRARDFRVTPAYGRSWRYSHGEYVRYNGA